MTNLLGQLRRNATLTASATVSPGTNSFDTRTANTALTATLPSLTAAPISALVAAGVPVRVKILKAKGDSTGNPVTVTCAGSDTLESGATTLPLLVGGEKLTLSAETVPGTTTAVWVVEEHTAPRDMLDLRYPTSLVTTVNLMDPKWGLSTNTSTDMTSVVQAALNSFGSAGGTLLLPPWLVLIAGNLTWPTRVRTGSTGRVLGGFNLTGSGVAITASGDAIDFDNLRLQPGANITTVVHFLNCNQCTVGRVLVQNAPAAGVVVFDLDNSYEVDITKETYIANIGPSASAVTAGAAPGIGVVCRNTANSNNLRPTINAQLAGMIGIDLRTGCDANTVNTDDLEGQNAGTIGIRMTGAQGTTILGGYAEEWTAGAVDGTGGGNVNTTFIGGSWQARAASGAIIKFDGATNPNKGVVAINMEFPALNSGDSRFATVGMDLGSTTDFTVLGCRGVNGTTVNVLKLAGVVQPYPDQVNVVGQLQANAGVVTNVVPVAAATMQPGALSTWTAGTGNTSEALSTSTTIDGYPTLIMSATAAGQIFVNNTASKLFPVVGGVTYTASARFLALVGPNANCRIDINWYDASSNLLSSASGNLTADNISTPTTVTSTKTAPAAAVYAQVLMRVTASVASGDQHAVTEVVLAPAAGSTQAVTVTPAGVTQQIGQLAFVTPAGVFVANAAGVAQPLTAASMITAVKIVTASYTLTAADDLIILNGGSTALTATFPASAPVGRSWRVKNRGTVAATLAGGTFDGITSLAAGASVRYTWDGNQYCQN